MDGGTTNPLARHTTADGAKPPAVSGCGVSRRRDAALALAVACLGAGALVWEGGPISTRSLAVGAAATLLAEALLTARSAFVRRHWADRRVRTLAVAGGVALVAVAAVAGTDALSALVGGLVAYVVLLVAVSAWERLRPDD